MAIPKVIKKMMKEDSPNTIVEENAGKIFCKFCRNKLSKESCQVIIDKDCNQAFSCHSCLRMQMSTKQVIYHDNWEFFFKRWKSGFIKSMIADYKKAQGIK